MTFGRTLPLCKKTYPKASRWLTHLHSYTSLVRSVPRERSIDPTFKVVIKSGYLLKACKDVIRTWPGISWNSDPLEVEMFLR